VSASAENISSKESTGSANPRPASSGAAVAHEAPVIATGARTEKSSGKRELFKETTTTALVFPNGGVIRLSAAVGPGQLLFLTNQRTKREVVAQVTRRRNNPATGYYVELEFTETAPDFWGLAFPENAAEAPANRQQPPAAELFQSAEHAADDLSPNAPAPSASDVKALMEEVEALRAQLKSMQSQVVATNAAPPEETAPTPAEHPAPVAAKSHDHQEAQQAPAASASSGPAPSVTEMLSSLLTPGATAKQSSPASEARDDTVPAAASNRAAEARPTETPPVGDHKVAREEELLPKPALDFHHARAAKEVAPIVRPKAAAADRLGSLRLALLATVSLFAVMLGAWNMHWLPWSSGGTGLSGRAASAVRPAVSPSAAVRPAQPQKAEAHAGSGATSQPPNALPSQPDAAASSEQPSKSEAGATPAVAEERPASPVDGTAKSAHKEESAPVVSVAKRSTVRPSEKARGSSISGAEDNVAIVPPRLIKSVRAVAPGDALRKFVTGNVTLDALIDKTGHVKSMRVLSGPASFHKAAMEALKQYVYEPARQDGKPVSAHITVTVPFWFEP
jgi:TonB family protein